MYNIYVILYYQVYIYSSKWKKKQRTMASNDVHRDEY